MKQAIVAALLTLAVAGVAHAQNATTGLGTMPGISGESSGTVTGSGTGRDGAFGSPTDDPREVGAARSSTAGNAKGAAPAKGGASTGRGTGTGTDKRGSAPAGTDPR